MDFQTHITEIPYSGPYKGIDVQTPETLLEPAATPNSLNFEFRNKELRTSPRLSKYIPHPDPTQPIRGLTSFVDSNNVVHTLAITRTTLWQLIYRKVNSGNPWTWNRVADFNTNGIDSQYAVQIFLDRVYWTTGTPGVFNWDGISNNLSEATGNLYGGYFLGELDFHLILCNTVENVAGVATAFPQRIRWAASGLPNQWNPAANPNAGFNDMLDVPDSITGYITIGRQGYIFRVNGITNMIPTGNAANPFQFNHMWASDRGIGSAYSQTIASYGPVGIFISTEDVYKITPGTLQNIGGGARDKIINDLADATGPIVATMISGYHKRYVYPCYKLCIPQGNNSVIWTFALEDNNWSRRIITQGAPTCKMRICITK